MTSKPAAAGASLRDRLAAIPQSRLVVGALAFLTLLSLFLLYIKGSDMTFFYDEWSFVVLRHQNTVGVFLEPHNEHFSLVPVIVYKILFATVGLDHYEPYRVVVLLLHATLGVLVFLFVRSRTGNVLALAAATLLLFLGAGWEDVLWPFQMGFLLALIGGLGSLLLLERENRAADFGAMILLGISLASASLGIPMALGLAAYLLVRPARRDRLWVVLVPLLLYAIWYADYGRSALKGENVTRAPAYTAEEIAGSVGAVAGLGVEWGRVLAAAAVAGLGLHLSRIRKLPRSFVMVLTAAASFWLLTALARADLNEPTASRYVYAGGMLVLLVAAEAMRGRSFSTRALVVVAVLTTFAAVSGMETFKKGAGGLRSTDRIVRAEITPLEIGGSLMPASFAPDVQRAPTVTARKYLEAIADIGSSPAYTESELGRIDESRRARADDVFVRGYRLSLRPAVARPRGAPPAVRPSATLSVRRSGSCVVARPVVPGAAVRVVLRVPTGGMSLQAPAASVRLRRFASGFEGARVLGGDPGAGILRVPRDRSARPWYAQVAGPRPIRACGLGG